MKKINDILKRKWNSLMESVLFIIVFLCIGLLFKFQNDFYSIIAIIISCSFIDCWRDALQTGYDNGGCNTEANITMNKKTGVFMAVVCMAIMAVYSFIVTAVIVSLIKRGYVYDTVIIIGYGLYRLDLIC